MPEEERDEALLFVYGTLRDAGAFRQVTGHPPNGPGLPARLRGWRRRMFSDGSYHFIEPAEGAEVDGFVLTIRRSDLPALDRYEDVGVAGEGLYRRVQVEAEVIGSGTVRAFAYAAGERGARR